MGKRPSVRVKKFVQELVNNPGGTQTDAYLTISPNVSRQVAASRATDMLSRPHVQEHINDVLARDYPNLAKNCSDVLLGYLTDPEVHPNLKLKCIDMLAKYQGWLSPTKIDKREIKVDLAKFKLPGDV